MTALAQERSGRMSKVSIIKLVAKTVECREIPSDYNISCPEDAADVIDVVSNMKECPSEEFWVFSLNSKNKVIAAEMVSKGSLNMSIVHPREVFKFAIMHNAASIILAHNHPSGNPRPSQEDINITKRLVQAGKLLGISVLDHIIIGDTYKSLKNEGYV